MSLSGNLKTVSFPDILQLLAAGKKTGLLEIRTQTRQKEVAFRDGNIIYASSLNSSEDLLGNMLLAKGKITKTDLDRAITMHKQSGRQLGSTLIDMQLFDTEEIAECLRMQIEEIVYNLFSWHEGDFILHEGKLPANTPFIIELSTMNVLMEGTRRVDEWVEIQKVLPPDNIELAVNRNPKSNDEEIVLSLDEFKILALINGQRTLPELIGVSPIGEFVTCRAVYKLIVNNLVIAGGKREERPTEIEDEEDVVLAIIFTMYNSCFFRIRSLVESIVGESSRYAAFTAQYRNGLLMHFTGFDPQSEEGPSYDKYLTAVKTLPPNVRYHKLMTGLDGMLSEHLEFVFQVLGVGPFREAVGLVKKEITEPLATRREIVKRYHIEDNLYKTIKRADRVVKMVRG